MSKNIFQTTGSSRESKFDFPSFQKRFLKAFNEEIVFYFVYGIFRMKRFTDEIYEEAKKNVFGSLLEANALFDLCLVVDGFIKSKYSNPAEAAEATFGAHLLFLSQKREHRLSTPLSFIGNRVGDLNGSFKNNFGKTLQDLLDSNYIFQDGSTLQPVENDFAIVYGLRNFGGHRIENQPIINEKFFELSGRVLNVLFFLVENCQ